MFQVLQQAIEYLKPILQKSSYAFKKLICIIKCGSSTRAQLLCGIDGALQGEASSVGVTLQCCLASSDNDMVNMMVSISKSEIQLWQQKPLDVKYTVSDMPVAKEVFLER